MNWLWQGIILGMSLSILMGPMMFLFMQLGIERGFRAGAAAGLGAWMSDLVYILLVYFGISYLLRLTQWQGFKMWTGIIGGGILIVIGLSTLLRNPPSRLTLAQSKLISTSASTYLRLWFKGFLINTFNPFAAFFWLSVMTAAGSTGELSGPDATLLFSGILGSVMLTDVLKILLAKRIKPWLKYSYIVLMRRVSGTAMVILGVVLMIRVIL